MLNQNEKLSRLIKSSTLEKKLKDFWLAALPLLEAEEINQLLIALTEAKDELATIK